jgi:hypothetical protein
VKEEKPAVFYSLQITNLICPVIIGTLSFKGPNGVWVLPSSTDGGNRSLYSSVLEYKTMDIVRKSSDSD